MNLNYNKISFRKDEKNETTSDEMIVFDIDIGAESVELGHILFLMEYSCGQFNSATEFI